MQRDYRNEAVRRRVENSAIITWVATIVAATAWVVWPYIGG